MFMDRSLMSVLLTNGFNNAKGSNLASLLENEEFTNRARYEQNGYPDGVILLFNRVLQLSQDLGEL